MAKDGFNSLSQEIGYNVWDLVEQKRFYLYKYMSNFVKFKEQLPNKASLAGKKLLIMKMFLRFGISLRSKKWITMACA